MFDTVRVEVYIGNRLIHENVHMESSLGAGSYIPVQLPQISNGQLFGERLFSVPTHAGEKVTYDLPGCTVVVTRIDKTIYGAWLMKDAEILEEGSFQTREAAQNWAFIRLRERKHLTKETGVIAKITPVEYDEVEPHLDEDDEA